MKTVEQRYGKSFEELTRSLKFRNFDGSAVVFKQTELHGIIYQTCGDYLTNDIGHFPLFDGVLSYADLKIGDSLGGNLIVRKHGLNKAVLTLDNVDEWLEKVQAPNTIKSGARYQEIEQIWTSYSVDSLGSFKSYLSVFSDMFSKKEKQYNLIPGAHLNNLALEYEVMEHNGVRVLEIHELCGTLTDGTPVYNWVAFKLSNGVMYAPFVLLSQDAEVQKRYKPSICSHVAMTRYAKYSKCIKVDYGAYFNYKRMLAFDTEWVPGIAEVTDNV